MMNITFWASCVLGFLVSILILILGGVFSDRRTKWAPLYVVVALYLGCFASVLFMHWFGYLI